MIFWVASYPKNGNTWLRSILSAYYFTKFKYNKNIPTSTTEFWIKAQELINKEKKIKFFKTHNIYSSVNNNKFSDKFNSIGAVYIVRDPRNVITSLMNHFEMNQKEALAFMLSEKKYTYDNFKKDDFSDFQLISSWKLNYKSWINNNDFLVKLIKYENLLKQTFYEVRELIRFINKTCKLEQNFDKIKAQNAIQTSSFEKLKTIEENQGFSESILSKKNNDNKVPFFHLGPKNNWKINFDSNFAEELNVNFKESLNELEYN